MTRLKGASIEAICEAIETAVHPDDRTILDKIAEQVREYEEAFPDQLHGFGEWILRLRDGISSLPERLPRAYLEAWRNGYISIWNSTGKPWCPMPFWRCEDCRLVAPHVTGVSPCLSCGSERVCFADLSKTVADFLSYDPSYNRNGV